ncbi:MAG TPA: hypothetical protein VFJ77_05315 [Gaiellaceae bacterium]|nr:hypothetical protein [Gaiellaceae bacterium]
MRAAAVAVASLALAACAGGGARTAGVAGSAHTAAGPGDLRIAARPGAGRGRDCAPGTHTLRLGGGYTALMRVTAGGSGPRTLLLALHGSGDTAGGGLWIFRAAWDEPGLVLLAPNSAGGSWSLANGDLAAIDRSLRRAFARCRIAPARVAVGGFSAGAALAVLLGLANGRLFHAVVALSPGDSLPPHRTGKPRVFVAHGRHDRSIPIAQGGDALVPRLRRLGYRVVYDRFRDGHAVPREVSEAAVRWLLRGFRGG